MRASHHAGHTSQGASRGKQGTLDGFKQGTLDGFLVVCKQEGGGAEEAEDGREGGGAGVWRGLLEQEGDVGKHEQGSRQVLRAGLEQAPREAMDTTAD